ncbi:MAG TPA: bifunctional nicotinamidase/pyrazinamidase [Parachlamydiaceae bacterium]|nr:bifunctional nicotinamidase/pyrazinamidase [Parachlamydiaceae bacterium]
MKKKSKKALILVDIQNDFLPGGSLAVPDGNEILPVIEKLVALPFDFIIATKDWHPKDHISFAANHRKAPGTKIKIGNIQQILWPVHCVQETHGSELAVGAHIDNISKIIHKGTDKSIDSYSTFFDNGQMKSTGLSTYLHTNHINELYIAGLATDYCVKYSVIDALHLGFKTFVVTDACRGINIKAKDSERALNEMQKSGAILTTFQELAKSI